MSKILPTELSPETKVYTIFHNDKKYINILLSAVPNLYSGANNHYTEWFHKNESDMYRLHFNRINKECSFVSKTLIIKRVKYSTYTVSGRNIYIKTNKMNRYFGDVSAYLNFSFQVHSDG